MINRTALDAEITEYRKHKSLRHKEGRCGGMADLCADCHRNEFEVMLRHAQNEPALPGEDQTTYTKRIGLPMYDTWYEVATKMIRSKAA